MGSSSRRTYICRTCEVGFEATPAEAEVERRKGHDVAEDWGIDQTLSRGGIHQHYVAPCGDGWAVYLDPVAGLSNPLTPPVSCNEAERRAALLEAGAVPVDVNYPEVTR